MLLLYFYSICFNSTPNQNRVDLTRAKKTSSQTLAHWKARMKKDNETEEEKVKIGRSKVGTK